MFDATDLHLPAGLSIGPYRLICLIGEGGMGQVYLAEHGRLRCQVAVKVLSAHYAKNEEVVRRFFNEALAVNVVRHPGLVEVFDAGQLDDGRAYFVMEHLPGQPLRALLGQGRLPPGQALALCQQIADALAAAHDKGIIHRDLKPDNIMLLDDPGCPESGGLRTKVLDFGVAKVAAEHQRQEVRTKEGAVMGTPAYMAPEQWMSTSGVDDRADVYALGVIFYQMLAGAEPFVADNPARYMNLHLYEEPAALLAQRPELPAQVAALAHRLLAKTRAARPSMRELSAALAGLRAGAPDGEFADEVTVALPRGDVAGMEGATVVDMDRDMDIDLSPRPLRRLWSWLRAALRGHRAGA